MVVNSASLEEENVDDDKKKNKTSDFAKIAKALGEIIKNNIKVSLININTSDYGFIPDIKNNRILYGLKALGRINADIVEQIKAGRPYSGIKDFMLRCPLNKTVMVNLIKSGAFDEIETDFKDRKSIMAYYLSVVSEPKKKLTLSNFNGLIQHGLVPIELEFQVRIFNFNNYLKKYQKIGKYYQFNDECQSFFDKFLIDESDKLEVINGVTCIVQTDWKKIYDKYMSVARDYIKEHQEEMLNELNKSLFMDFWNKYASGNLSHWEMESLCFYYGDHELKNINVDKYGIVDFNELDREPVVDYFFKRAGRQIPIYKLFRIAGTVIAKNDNKSVVTLLTTTGVVDVKFTREYYSMFKKQISDIGEDGSKHVVEKGWFSRGNMLLVTGFRRDDMFIGKTYKATSGHQLYKITDVQGDTIAIQHERWSTDTSEEMEDYEQW